MPIKKPYFENAGASIGGFTNEIKIHSTQY
jgi:hypothetical protein